MIEMVCIVCPKGCRLSVDPDMNVDGTSCEHGVHYAREEVLNPTRTLTSTVSITGAAHRRCPVKTKLPIPRSLMFDAMGLLDDVELVAPVEEGTVVVEDVCGTGISFVTTRSL